MSIRLLFFVSVFCAAAIAPADEPSKTIASAASASAPTIDGKIGDDEWKEAEPVAVDLKLMAVNPPSADAGTRSCTLQVMNSANALYIAWRVPDESLDASLSPIDLDVAILAFCRGDELARGDDRKTIASGLFVDKHVSEPGQDADDARRDGRGAVAHADGFNVFEWAIPLDSGDDEDLRAKPGDCVRFNLAYFDSFASDLKGTELGVAFGADLNQLAGWAAIELAADVENDDGGAFGDAQWIEPLFAELKDTPAGRLRLSAAAELSGQTPPIGLANFDFDYIDPRGMTQTARAKFYLPKPQGDVLVKLPLYFVAGYEADDGSAAALARQGFVVCSPADVNPNPLVRTANPDFARLHMARSLPFIDDAKVTIGGGSAGGYMTLMLAAETFPLAGAAPDVPPINWGYNAAFFLAQRGWLKEATAAGTPPAIPVMAAIVPLAEQSVPVYGDDTDDQTWWRHSPLAQLDTITCPVSVFWSTADILVPIDQVGDEWVQPFDASLFPAGFAISPDQVCQSREARTRLVDALPKDRYEVFVLPLPDGAVKKPGQPAQGIAPIELPVSERQWSIAIVDEGPPEPQADHFNHVFGVSRVAFLKQCREGRIAVDQLTAAKLERLMDRYAGREWLETALVHLDDRASERADVLRGLRTYVACGEEHSRRFAELYAMLPAERQVLDADGVKELTFGSAAGR